MGAADRARRSRPMPEEVPDRSRTGDKAERPLLRPGETCWRVTRAERAALLLDGEDYFRRLREALLAARRDVFILGWDFDPRLELLRGEAPDDGAPTRLGELLDFIVSRIPLRATRPFVPPRVYLLLWDYSSLFATGREPLSLLRPDRRLRRRLKRRVRLVYDAKHPFGAAHHQKLVVIDDQLAFVGGMDLTAERWDSAEHARDDPRRREPGVPTYEPHHDVMALVSGPVARDLGELCRMRWRRASHRRVRKPRPNAPRLPWPAGLAPDLVDVPVAIARTSPAFGGEVAVREVERLHLEGIARARRTMYLETQYLTSRPIAAALADRLRDPQGPEVVLVHSREPAGWLEQWALGALIRAAHAELMAGDHHGRLRLVYPVAARAADEAVYVHSKVALIDERWLRVGSANLNQRSMGLDTECDLVFEARDEAQRAALRRILGRLVGHWSGRDAGQVLDAAQDLGSLCAALDRWDGEERGLALLDVGEPPGEEAAGLADLDEPIEPTRLVDRFLPELRAVGTLRGRGPELVLVGAVLLVTALALLWRFTPLLDLLPLERVEAWPDRFTGRTRAVSTLFGTFVLGTLVGFPVHLLMLATVLVFGGWLGGVQAYAALLLAAALHWALARSLPPGRLEALLGAWFGGLVGKLRGANRTQVLAVRLLPLAPFGLVNLAFGAARTPLRTYLVGTALGFLPATLGIVLFGAQARAVLRSSHPLDALLLVAIAAAFTAIVWLLQRQLATHRLSPKL